MSKIEAVAVGINYAGTPNALSGCINDAINVGKFWTDLGVPCDVVTDDVNPDKTTANGIIQLLDDCARRSFVHNLEYMCLSFSCHGTQVKDKNKDEKDGKDEALVGSDMRPVTDDFIQVVMGHFNPKTKVLMIFDCCHSATIGDFLLSWTKPYKKPVVENILCNIKSKIISISGCLDAGTSADAYNIHGDKKYSGALTTFLLDLIPKHKNNIFELVDALHDALKKGGFKQHPKICSTYNLALEPAYLPAKLTAEKKKRAPKKASAEKKGSSSEPKKRKAAPKKEGQKIAKKAKRAPPKKAVDEDDDEVVEEGETVEVEEEGQLDLEDDE
jgi:hypothetical protein